MVDWCLNHFWELVLLNVMVYFIIPMQWNNDKTEESYMEDDEDDDEYDDDEYEDE